jgi:hypothetical protein
MIPQIRRARLTIRATIWDDDTFKLFILRANEIEESAAFPLSLSFISSSHSLATSCTLVRIVCSILDASARRNAVGGIVPGFARACCRTKARARFTAATAMPSHTFDQRMWLKGTCVSLAMSENGVLKICSHPPEELSMKGGLQVPRIPSVSHTPF